jgi:hypothetical protein
MDVIAQAIAYSLQIADIKHASTATKITSQAISARSAIKKSAIVFPH